MSDAERVALGTTLAGKNQYKVLASVMSNFGTATEASAAALNSAGSAARENAKYLESIEAKANAVSAAFQQWSTAVVDSDLVKGILDIGKAVAQFGSTNIGATITQFVLLSGISWGGLQLLGQSILPGIIAGFTSFNAVLEAGSIAAAAEAAGITTLKMAISASLPVILAVSASIVTLVAIVKAAKDAYDKAHPSIEAVTLAMKEAQSALTDTQKKYTDSKEKLDELNKTPFEARTSEINEEIERLEALVAYYEALSKARQQEAIEATASYLSTVEKQGIGMGDVSVFKNTGDIDEYGQTILRLQGNYESLASAIGHAAAEVYDFYGKEIDISNLEEAQKSLRKYGYTFEQISVPLNTIRNGLTHVYDEIQRGEKLTPSTIDQYRDLISASREYAEALQSQIDNGVALNSEQQRFLDTYNNTTQAYQNYITQLAEGNNWTVEQTEQMIEASAALSDYAQNLLAAASAYETFKNRLAETGDYDDNFKGLVSIFNEINSEFEKGQVGSQTFLTGLELLTGQSFTSAEAVEYLNQNMETLKLIFGDAESGGMGLITALEDLGYASVDANGNIAIGIESFSDLAKELGISESSLYAVTKALRVMGVDVSYGVSDVLAEITKLGDSIVKTQNGISSVDVSAFVQAAQSAGQSSDEILAIVDLLAEASNVELTNVEEGISKIGSNAEDTSSEAQELNDELGGVTDTDFSGVTSGVNDFGEGLSSAASAASDLSGSLSKISNFKFPSLASIFQNAKGTSHAKEGDSLVNEEGAELIQSGNKAYIAGGGLPTVTHLHEGDIVYTADETKKILKGKKLSGAIQSHRMESAYTVPPFPSSGNTGGTGIDGVTITGGRDGSGGQQSGGSGSGSGSQQQEEDPKEIFDEWLKAKKHALEMDEITEEEYYNDLEVMINKYFKNNKKYQDEYRKYQEQIYKWRKAQAEKEEEEKKKKEEEERKAAEKKVEEEKKAYKNKFDTWLADQKHALAMDEITEEEYYKALKKKNEKYFGGKKEYQEEYRKYQEQIYAWEKKKEQEAAEAKKKVEEEKKKKEEETAKEKEKKSEEEKKAYKAEFDTWLKGRKHALEMDEISEEQYYKELKKKNEEYFGNSQDFQEEYWKYQEQIHSWEKKQAEKSTKEAEESSKKKAEAYKSEFETWLAAQNHALAMGIITEDQYYEDLEKMNDEYFKDRKEYQDEYWKYEEKIYAWKLKKAEEENKLIEAAIKSQIELEKKRNDLEKARAIRLKVYKNGQFRYVSDRDTLATAQAALSAAGYAEGTFSASGGLSLVGEHGAEMRVLNKGDGIIPSDITNNLWNWGKLNPADIFNKNNNGNSTMYQFNISDLVLPNAKDAAALFNGIKSYALQYITQRG